MSNHLAVPLLTIVVCVFDIMGVDVGRTAGDFHGTINGYSYHGCRCDKCVEANRVHQLDMTEQRAKREVPEHVHGTRGGYTNYKCPCDRCRGEYLRTQAVYRERRKQRA